MDISAVVITKNAEQRIERCIRSLSFADEVIVVVDSATKDATAQKAQELGATVIIEPWYGYGMQKNIGMQHAKGTWVLFVDDDEEVPKELAQDIMEAIQNQKEHVVWLKIVTVFLGKPLAHLYGHNPRLLRKGSASWSNAHVHEQVVLPDNTTAPFTENSHVLPHALLHHSHPTIASYLKKMHRYTTLDAKQMITTHTHRNGKPVRNTILLAPYLAMRQFGKLLIYRKGILDGIPGIIWCTLSAYYEWEMARKYQKILSQAQAV